jgi:hypothetical protein
VRVALALALALRWHWSVIYCARARARMQPLTLSLRRALRSLIGHNLKSATQSGWAALGVAGAVAAASVFVEGEPSE